MAGENLNKLFRFLSLVFNSPNALSASGRIDGGGKTENIPSISPLPFIFHTILVILQPHVGMCLVEVSVTAALKQVLA